MPHRHYRRFSTGRRRRTVTEAGSLYWERDLDREARRIRKLHLQIAACLEERCDRNPSHARRWAWRRLRRSLP
jgi:hypothetical protein